MKKPKCYNCKHASKGFKIGAMTQHMCGLIKPIHDPFDALMDFWHTCNKHEYKQTNEIP